ncbi:MAG: 5'/3'-nucleotidase SurE [Bacilli bacterium]|nr:5'/3'-nucleotidase SurE [Bacilli bacterium]
MKILVTNDDSINAIGLWELVKLAEDYGEVKVLAPKFEQSGKSHAINVHEGFVMEKYKAKVEAYSLASTPADCVRAARYGLDWDFDIVFSGINNGLNLGEDIFYSGTCAAATEAALMGKRALAFSTYPGAHETLSVHFKEIMDFIFKNKLLEEGCLYNINIPLTPKGIKLTFQGNTHYDTRFVLEEGLYYQKGRHHFENEVHNLNSDVWAVHHNYISITPLNFDRTDYMLYQKLFK